jgi:hypothetical protein
MMKYTLFLLAAVIGSVSGVELFWNVLGRTTIGEPCSAEAEELFYEECLEDVAISMGVNLSRLELEGNRDLQSQKSVCSGGCCPENCSNCNCYPKGTYCWTKCSKDRRLIITEEQAHTASFLVATGQIQSKVRECLHRKVSEGYTCIGNPEDVTMEIFVSDEAAPAQP